MALAKIEWPNGNEDKTMGHTIWKVQLSLSIRILRVWVPTKNPIVKPR